MTEKPRRQCFARNKKKNVEGGGFRWFFLIRKEIRARRPALFTVGRESPRKGWPKKGYLDRPHLKDAKTRKDREMKVEGGESA